MTVYDCMTMYVLNIHSFCFQNNCLSGNSTAAGLQSVAFLQLSVNFLLTSPDVEQTVNP